MVSASQSNIWYGTMAHTSKTWFIPFVPIYVVYIYVWKYDLHAPHKWLFRFDVLSSRSEPMTNFDILFGPDRVDDSCTSMAQFIPIYQPSAGRHDHRLFICQSIFITQKIMMLAFLCLYGSLGSNYWPTRTFNALVSLYTEYTNIFLPANIG